MARHLAIALRLHARWCRANGVPVPDGLADLARFLLASGGLERTTLDGDSGADHDGFMPLTLDYHGVAARLGISERTVRRMVSRGELQSVIVGGRRRVRTADLEDYVASLVPEICRVVMPDDSEIIR